MPFLLTLLGIVLSYCSPGALFPTLSKYHLEIIILLPAAAATAVTFTMRGAKLQYPQHILIIGLWFAVVVSLLSKRYLRASMEGFFEFGLPVCIFFLVSMNVFSPGRVRVFCTVMAILALVLAGMSIAAYHTGFMQETLVLERGLSEDGDLSRRIRSLGFLNDPNDFAQFLLIGIAFLGAFWNKRNALPSFLALTPPSLMLLYAIYLTHSRGAMVGIAVLAFVVISSRLGKMASVALTAMLLPVMVALQFSGGRETSLRDVSTLGRLNAWSSGLGQFKSHFLFGSGYGQFTEFHEQTAHNSYVLCFSELGLFGYFFFLALIVVTVMGLERLVRASRVTDADYQFGALLNCVRGALYTFLVTSWFLSRTYTITAYLLLALATAMVHMRPAPVTTAQTTPPPRRWIPVTVALQFATLFLVYVSVRLRSL